MAQRISTRASAGATAILAALLLAMPARAPAYDVGPSSCPYVNSPLGLLSVSALQRSVQCMLNEQRVRHGRRATKSYWRLRSPARYHNRDMVLNLGFLTHASSNGENLVQRIRRWGYMRGARSWSVGEIIAYAWGVTKTPRTIIRGWLNSPPHRAIMFKRKWRHFGVSARHGSPGRPLAFGAVYTVDYGRRN